MRYVAAIEYYPNCRGCDPGYLGYPQLMFFKSIKDILEYTLVNMQDYEVKTVHSTKTGNELFDISYEIGQHSCNGISVTIRNKKFRTVDDGSGNLVWKASV